MSQGKQLIQNYIVTSESGSDYFLVNSGEVALRKDTTEIPKI